MPRKTKSSAAPKPVPSTSLSESPFLDENQLESEQRFNAAIMQEETRQLRQTSHDYTVTSDNPFSNIAPSVQSFMSFFALALDRRQMLSTYIAVAQETYTLEQLDSMPLVRLENLYNLLTLDFPIYQ